MKKAVKIMKALAEQNRLRVISILLKQKEICACQIIEMLGISAATVSRHMGILQNAELIESRKDGKWVHYRLSESIPEKLLIWLQEIAADSDDTIVDIERIKG